MHVHDNLQWPFRLDLGRVYRDLLARVLTELDYIFVVGVCLVCKKRPRQAPLPKVLHRITASFVVDQREIPDIHKVLVELFAMLRKHVTIMLCTRTSGNNN